MVFRHYVKLIMRMQPKVYEKYTLERQDYQIQRSTLYTGLPDIRLYSGR